MPGRFFDEWEVGHSVAHALRRTVTETDNLLISTLTHNPQPLHLDAEAAAATEFGRILVNSCFTFSLLVGASVADTTEGVLVANLGFDEVRLPSPVFIGDTIHFESECVALRPSNSRPTAGLVTWAHRAINQRGETVCTMKRTALISKRPAQ
ncbi:MaoC family dehydratase [Sphingomonas swuensis]|uniref:MaoC family dehydratase n=1 Tax=Sphingomonas swuensis TaxID=977800 RepID=A0ABP7SJS7_9SPHN